MDTKFTKGEWKWASGDGTEKDVCITTDKRNLSSTGNICELDVFFDGEFGVEQKANANLIAAAPAMYKLLQKFLPMDEDGNGWDFQYNEGSEEMGQDVINLLAKARGES